LALFGEWVPIKNRCSRSRRPGDPEQDCRDCIRCGGYRTHAQQKCKGGIGIHAKCKGKQNGEPDNATKARDHAKNKAYNNAQKKETQSHRVRHDDNRIPGRIQHFNKHIYHPRARLQGNFCSILTGAHFF